MDRRHNAGCFRHDQDSVIVDDLDLLRIAVAPDEANAVLVIDPNAVLASPFALQRL